jgi:hypothetical protein
MTRTANSVGSLILTLAFSALCACGEDPERTPEVAPLPKQKSTDLVFKITRHEVHADGSQLFSAAGLLQGRTVGFDLELAPFSETPPGFVNMSTWQCTAHMRSQGAPSDELLQLMESLYDVGAAPSKMAASVGLQALSIWKNPSVIQTERVALVLMFDSRIDDTRDTPELWLDVDAKAKRMHLRERDKRRRGAVIAALGGTARS